MIKNNTQEHDMVLLTDSYKFLSKDDFDTCANYARLKDGEVEVETLYRYARPSLRRMSVENFNKLMANGEL